ncbi:MAG: septal ring lytic transglycosylase RlpA family protein [Gammaproteobacteria bacterium]
MALLSGCGTFSQNRDSAPAVSMDWDNIPDAVPRNEPLSERGNPESYAVNGRRYFVDHDTTGFKQRGVASWYGTKFHGRLTSSGDVYDMYKMTAAHKTLPLPSFVKVTNLRNQKQVIVKVNDRGPFVDNRIIDLSYAAAKKLGITRHGTANVEIEIVKPATGANGTTTSNTISTNEPDGNAGAPANHYYVQLGAFAERQRAEKLLDQLSSHAISPAAISRKLKQGNTLFLVRVGPLAGKGQLQSMESRLLELGYSQSYIIIE